MYCELIDFPSQQGNTKLIEVVKTNVNIEVQQKKEQFEYGDIAHKRCNYCKCKELEFCSYIFSKIKIYITITLEGQGEIIIFYVLDTVTHDKSLKPYNKISYYKFGGEGFEVWKT